jgi:ammonia channel protein AmtB
MLAGAGLLWMGWSGFNGGAPYAANTVAPIAVINTNICAATSLLVWTSLDVVFFGKPSVIGAVQGMMTGLVCITPGAGNARAHVCEIFDQYGIVRCGCISLYIYILWPVVLQVWFNRGRP